MQQVKDEGPVVSKRELRRRELTREKLDKMSFRALTRELSNECGVVPEVTGYREALWPDVLALEGSQEFANMLLWEAALRGNHSGLASLVGRGADVHARDDSRGGWCSYIRVCACVCLCARARAFSCLLFMRALERERACVCVCTHVYQRLGVCKRDLSSSIKRDLQRDLLRSKRDLLTLAYLSAAGQSSTLPQRARILFS